MNETLFLPCSSLTPRRSGGDVASVDHRFCVAPMMECTDRHCRYFLRLVTRRALLYTEMVTAAAIVHGDRQRLLGFRPEEYPVALQIGGSDPEEVAEAARIGADFGYREINLNIGCPSGRVQSGRFGACLMAEPERVAACVSAMRAAVDIPVTVKCRIGIDDMDPEETLDRFVDAVAEAGCETFIVHARKAWLKGLSPKENRDVPPLDYERVYRLKRARPELEIIINGGIVSLEAAEDHLACVDGVMLGRAAYQDPYMLAEVDERLFDETGPVPSREEVLERFISYAAEELGKGARLHHLTRHILGLCHGQPGARDFRRHLSERASREEAGISVLQESLDLLSRSRPPVARAAAE